MPIEKILEEAEIPYIRTLPQREAFKLGWQKKGEEPKSLGEYLEYFKRAPEDLKRVPTSIIKEFQKGPEEIKRSIGALLEEFQKSPQTLAKMPQTFFDKLKNIPMELGLVSGPKPRLEDISLVPSHKPIVVKEPYGLREDKTPKGRGYFGPLKMTDGSGKVMTEYSITFDVDGKNILMPSIVPTLTEDEVKYLLTGKKITPEITRKAYEWGMKRIKEGKSPFSSPEEEGKFQPRKSLEGVTHIKKEAKPSEVKLKPLETVQEAAKEALDPIETQLLKNLEAERGLRETAYNNLLTKYGEISNQLKSFESEIKKYGERLEENYERISKELAKPIPKPPTREEVTIPKEPILALMKALTPVVIGLTAVLRPGKYGENLFLYNAMNESIKRTDAEKFKDALEKWDREMKVGLAERQGHIESLKTIAESIKTNITLTKDRREVAVKGIELEIKSLEANVKLSSKLIEEITKQLENYKKQLFEEKKFALDVWYKTGMLGVSKERLEVEKEKAKKEPQSSFEKEIDYLKRMGIITSPEQIKNYYEQKLKAPFGGLGGLPGMDIEKLKEELKK